MNSPPLAKKAEGKANEPDNSKDNEDLEDDVDTEIFDKYVPSADIRGHEHPSPLIQTTALSSVKLPRLLYQLQLPVELIDEGLLSTAQIETICYACQIHDAPFSADGYRKGYFIGDGTGVGKGRQLAGIILENVIKHKILKHVWVSASANLMEDAKRDLGDIGFERFSGMDLPCINIIDTKKKSELPCTGILFSTYAALIRREEQIIRWLGTDFKGCIVFDECHKAKGLNLDSKSAENTENNSTKTGLVVKHLQDRLPCARVVYCSATGATNAENLGFMSRLNLWGNNENQETVFKQFNNFKEAAKRGGIGIMEIVSAYLKSKGQYNSRTLSYEGCTFRLMHTDMLQEQIHIYDSCCILWKKIYTILMSGIENQTFEYPILEEEELRRLNNQKSVYDEDEDARPLIIQEFIVEDIDELKKYLKRYFWSAHQRFFRSLCVSLKVPTILKLGRSALDEGQCVVIGLQGTGEANLKKENKYKSSKNDDDSVDDDEDKIFSAPARMLKSLIVKTMPLPKIKPSFIGKEYDSKAGEKRKRMKVLGEKTSRCKLENDGIIVIDSDDDDDNGDGDVNDEGVEFTEDNIDIQYFEALGKRLELFERIDALGLPGNPLDVLINEFGTVNVAELTGRKMRTNRKGEFESRTRDGESVNERNLAEKAAFMDGDKLVAIISDAASTGISLHAMNGARNQRRRLHVTVELAWSSDRMVQQLGRTHRSNQSSSPAYILIMSPQGGESRFGSAVCKRMQSMGALTQGDRSASSGIQTLDAFNFDTTLGKKALEKLLDALPNDNRKSSKKITSRATELLVLDASNDEALINEAAEIKGCEASAITFSIAAKLWLESINFNFKSPTVSSFFNRLLGLETKKQNYLFTAFEKTFELKTNEARKEGTLDQGISRVQGKILKFENPEIVLSHKYILATDVYDEEHTKHAVVKADRGISWNEILDIKKAAEEEFEKRQNDLREIELALGYKYVERQKDGKFGFYEINDSDEISILYAADYLPVSYNKIVNYIQVWRPKTGRSAQYRNGFTRKYSKIEDLEEARQLWIEEYSREDSGTEWDNRVVMTHLITGSILPVWSLIDKVIADSTKTKRYKIKIMKSKIDADAENGIEEQRILGIFVDERLLQKMLHELSNYRPATAVKQPDDVSRKRPFEDSYTRMEVSDNGGTWICRYCTCENDNSEPNCAACDSAGSLNRNIKMIDADEGSKLSKVSKSFEEPLGEDHDKTWQCSFCTLLNTYQDLNCNACLNEKQSDNQQKEKSSNESSDENTKLDPNGFIEENENKKHTSANAAVNNNSEHEKIFDMIMNPQNSCDYEKLKAYLFQEGINEADDLLRENIIMTDEDPLKHVKIIADLLKSVKRNRFLTFYNGKGV